MAIQLCPVDTANVHPRNILGSSSSFDRERLSPFGSLSSRCWETVVYITLSSGPAWAEHFGDHGPEQVTVAPDPAGWRTQTAWSPIGRP